MRYTIAWTFGNLHARYNGETVVYAEDHEQALVKLKRWHKNWTYGLSLVSYEFLDVEEGDDE